MVGNLFWEHGHRMVATTVGILTIVLAIYLFVEREATVGAATRRVCSCRRDCAGIARWADRKTDAAAWLSQPHTRPWRSCSFAPRSVWRFSLREVGSSGTPLEEKGTLPLRYLCTAALVTIFLQLILGATLRHSATWDQASADELVLAHIGGAIAVTIMLGSAAFDDFAAAQRRNVSDASRDDRSGTVGCCNCSWEWRRI